MLDEGVVAIVPVDTTFDPKVTGAYDIHSMRTGKILEWYPEHIRVRVYNERSGRKEEIVIPKRMGGDYREPAVRRRQRAELDYAALNKKA
jgi:hypothetical protein